MTGLCKSLNINRLDNYNGNTYFQHMLRNNSATDLLMKAESGECRREELTYLRKGNIEVAVSVIKVAIPNTKQKLFLRLFTISVVA